MVSSREQSFEIVSGNKKRKMKKKKYIAQSKKPVNASSHKQLPYSSVTQVRFFDSSYYQNNNYNQGMN